MSSPLVRFNKNNQLRWESLVDFPEWERNSVLNWIHALLCPRDTWGDRTYDYSILSGIQSRERIMLKQDLGIPIESWLGLNAALTTMISSNKPELEENVIIFVELLVKYVRDLSEYHRFGNNKATPSTSILNSLENILSNGSKWTVVKPKNAEAGLVERVSPELMQIAIDSSNSDLFKAWGHAFGATPNPELAISHAQSAIEYIASKSGLTNATSKVYGSIIGDIKTHKGKLYRSVSKPEFDKTLSLSKQSGAVIDDLFADWFSAGMDLIQKSNPSRHKSKETEHFNISPEAARQAVLIATSIYEMIDKKYIYKTK